MRQVRLQMLFEWASDSERAQLRDELRRCRHGADPVVIVPNTSRDVVLFGRPAPDPWSSTYQPTTVQGGPVVVREMPGPIYAA